MNILNYTYSTLVDLKERKYSFTHCINKKINANEVDANMVIPVKDALKAVMNRYYFLSWEVKHYLKGIALKEDVLDYLIIALAFIRYARNVEFTKVEKELFEALENLEAEIPQDIIVKMLQDLKENVTELPEVFDDNFSRKVSLKYSYPEWLVTMYRKHFGTKNTYRSISSTRRATPISICLNDLLVGEIDNPSFKKTETTSNSYYYIGKKKLYEEDLFLERKIFVLDQSEQKVLDELKIIQGEKILMIGEFDPSFIVDTCTKILDLGKVRVACPTYENLLNVKKVVSKFKFKTFEAFESPLSLVCTYSEKNNDRVIVLPPSSEFGLVKRKPEVLISFKREEFDHILENEYKHLKEASLYLSSDGELDYLVTTINKKESFLLVRRFLNENRDFGLISEQMIFPYEYNGEGIYYARLRKLGK